MLGVNRALLRHQVPGAVGPLVQRQYPVVLQHAGAALLRRRRVRVNGAGGIHIAFAVRPQPAEHALDIDDRALVADLLGRHQVAVLDADGLEDPIRRLQPLPARRRGSEGDAAGHVQADGLAGLALDLREQVDGVGLQPRHVRVRVERVDAARRVPGRPGGQYRSLDQAHVTPAVTRQVIEHRSADHAAADYCHAKMLHTANLVLVKEPLSMRPSISAS